MPFFAKLSAFIRLLPPCGVAAARTMTKLGVRETMQQARLEKTKTQSDQFAAIANVQPGCVALSELTDGGTGARRLELPESSDPLRQHAILFEAGLKGRPSPIAFLKGPETHASIARHGSVRQAQS